MVGCSVHLRKMSKRHLLKGVDFQEGRNMNDKGPADEAGGKLSSVIGDLPGVIAKFWAAVAAPLFELSDSLVAICYALGVGWDELNRTNVSTHLLPGEDAAKLLETYGLRSLLPIAVFVLLLGIAQTNAAIIHRFSGCDLDSGGPCRFTGHRAPATNLETTPGGLQQYRAA